MKRPVYVFGILIIVFLSVMAFDKKQTEPWTPDQLMQPEKLAAIINDSAIVKPLIIGVGPVDLIKGAIKTGAAKERENLKGLRKLLSKEDRKRAIVIYCGCCPFKDCPNIRPAFSTLTEMEFTNHKLLNLPRNLKIDWINHGYPMNN
ncbi:MAG TPA: rhodanese-like domain-containing protein [Chitinophagaceae bacterium]|nr:rhodanese-like domain-containing protein [Chitinophagaceae bacterium]